MSIPSMSNPSKFTGQEVRLIKTQMRHQTVVIIWRVLLFSPILCLLVPYLPSKNGMTIERMTYFEAMLMVAGIVLVACIGIWFWHRYQIDKKFAELQSFLRKKKIGVKVMKIQSIFLSPSKIKITTDSEKKLSVLLFNKNEARDWQVGDEVEIIIEVQTKTVLDATRLA